MMDFEIGFKIVPLTRSSVDDAVGFFLENTDVPYISHSELMCGRADVQLRWSNTLGDILRAEFSAVVEKTVSYQYIELAISKNGQIVGLISYSLFFNASNPHGLLNDIVVDSRMRGKGIGRALVSRYEDALEKLAIVTSFLESGIKNDRAHSFFHSLGYETVSVTMMKRGRNGN